MFRSILFSIALALAATGCASRSTESIPAVRNFELDRYLGKWYEIARLPHRFERGMDHVSAEYTLLPDGTVQVVNRGVRNGELHEAKATAGMKSDPATGELEVSFFRPFKADYRIIRLDPGYTLAVVTSSDMDYLWLLSRTPRIPQQEVENFVDYARNLGFDTGKLEYPVQP